MNKKILLALVGATLLACNFLFPPTTNSSSKSTALPTMRVAETPVQETEPAPSPVEGTGLPPANTATSTASDSFTIVRLHPEEGDLPSLLASQAQKATAQSLMPVVEFDATWCPPCQAIDKGLKEQNPLMLDAYAGTYIIKLDVDEWGWGDSRLHDFDFDGIPVYFKLDAEGKPTGETVDGNAWGENIPENIAPVMDKFFHGE